MCDGITPQETFERLQTLDEKVRLRWVVPGMAGRENSIGGMGNTERRVWVRIENASNVKIKEAGHLVWSCFSVFRRMFSSTYRYLWRRQKSLVKFSYLFCRG
jgi:hypothetical protein